MTKRRWTTVEELEAEKDQDERNAKGCLERLGCAGEGCLVGTIQASCLALLIWVMV